MKSSPALLFFLLLVICCALTVPSAYGQASIQDETQASDNASHARISYYAVIKKDISIGLSLIACPIVTFSDQSVQDAINQDVQTSLIAKAKEYGASESADAPVVSIRYLSIDCGQYICYTFSIAVSSNAPYPYEGFFTLCYDAISACPVTLDDTTDTMLLAQSIINDSSDLFPLPLSGSLPDATLWQAQKDYLFTMYPTVDALENLLKDTESVNAIYNKNKLYGLCVSVPHAIGDTMVFSVPHLEDTPDYGYHVEKNDELPSSGL